MAFLTRDASPSEFRENMDALREEEGDEPHQCGFRCLGPLKFHATAKGEKITLSHGDCRATRDAESFRHGLVFTSRPIALTEGVVLRVERSLPAWEGALRLGFSTVCPTQSPIPQYAIPDLVDKEGYFGKPMPPQCSDPGTTLCFWMTRTGVLRCVTSRGEKFKMQTDLDITKTLWAWVDVYGHTTTVLLLGSIKQHWLWWNTSCPIPRSSLECRFENTPPKLKKRLEMLGRQSDFTKPLSKSPTVSALSNSAEESCVVCLTDKASLGLRCGHFCMCPSCATRVVRDFGKCPLCRQSV